MALQYCRILSSTTLSPGDASDVSLALDEGEYRELHVVLTVSSAGQGDTPKLVLRHAAVNDKDHYLDFETPVEISLTETGTAWFHVDTFTRWVCWFVSGTLTEPAVVTIDLIGKS